MAETASKETMMRDADEHAAGAEDGERGSTLFVNSLRKAFAVLQVFSRERPRLTLATVTRLTGLEKSAVRRSLFTLHELGYLRRDEDTKQYSLSPKLLEFGYAYLYSDRIVERAQPFLVEAHERTGETVNLAVLDGADIILISRLPARHVVGLNIQIGIRIPAIYSASGRAIAARLPAAERHRLIAQSRFEAHTTQTVLDRDEMVRLIEATERDGYAFVQSQFFNGDISFAAAVVDGQNRPLGAVSISVPDSRMGPEKARELLLPAAVEAARKTSVAMGAY
jgi:IclR family transcriptional regulator, pca regulon regulatory protein